MATLQRDPVAATIIIAAVEVHRSLGPGLLEGVYTTCLAYELHQRGLRVAQEVPIPVLYKGVHMVLTYLRLSNMKQAFLINFNGLTLMEGLRSYLGPRVDTSH